MEGPDPFLDWGLTEHWPRLLDPVHTAGEGDEVPVLTHGLEVGAGWDRPWFGVCWGFLELCQEATCFLKPSHRSQTAQDTLA